MEAVRARELQRRVVRRQEVLWKASATKRQRRAKATAARVSRAVKQGCARAEAGAQTRPGEWHVSTYLEAKCALLWPRLAARLFDVVRCIFVLIRVGHRLILWLHRERLHRNATRRRERRGRRAGTGGGMRETEGGGQEGER